MSDQNDDLFAGTAVKLRVLTPQQVQECRAVQQLFLAKGRPKSLVEVALELGKLTPESAHRVLEASAPDASEKTRIAPPSASEQVTRKALRPASARPSRPPEKKGKPAARADSKRGTRVAAKKPTALPLLAASFLGCAVLVGVVAVMLSGGEDSKPAPEPIAAAPVEESKPDPAKEPEPPPPPPPPPPVPETPKKEEKPPDPPAAKQDTEKADFEARQARKRAEAKELYEEIRAEIEEELKNTRVQKEALRKWLDGRPVTLALRKGGAHRNAIVQRFTPHTLIILAEGKIRRLSWDDVKPDSIRAAADQIFDPKNADAQFDRGRFFIARRDWARAGAAFKRAADLDLLYESDFSELDEKLKILASGEAAFRGGSRRVRRDVLLLKYDFRDPKQLEDFTPPLKAAKPDAVLEASENNSAVFLSGSDPENPPIFIEHVAVEMNVTPSGTFSVILIVGPNGGYELELGPKGNVLYRLVREGEDKVRREEFAKDDKRTIETGKRQEIRLLLEDRKITAYIGGKKALTAEDPKESEDAPKLYGRLGFRVMKGRVKLHDPLTITAQMDPSDLQHRVGDLEVLLRRSLDKDLEEMRQRRIEKMAEWMLQENNEIRLSADDKYFLWRIPTNAGLNQYSQLRNNILRFMGKAPGGVSTGFEIADARKELEKMIKAHPEVPSLYYLRALTHEEQQNYEGARKDVARALGLFDEFAEALILRAEYRRQHLDFKGAKEAVRKAIAACPDYGPAYVERAFLAFTLESRNPDAYERDLKIALELDPVNSRAISMLRVLRIQTKGPKDLGCRFDYSSEHYNVTTDISEEAAKAYAERLEAGFDYFRRTFSKFYGDRPFRKPRVVIFKTAENYYTYFELLSESRGEHTGGVFRPGLNELVFFESIDREESYHRLHHEAFHQFMTALTRDTPPYWFNEGTADYMGAIEVEGNRVTEKALLVPKRLRTIQWVLAVDAHIPFKKIMVETPREFYGPNSYLRYCQAWSMIHFFFNYKNGAYRPLIDQYFGMLRSGRSPQETFDDIIKPKVDTLEKEWKEYVLKLKLPSAK